MSRSVSLRPPLCFLFFFLIKKINEPDTTHTSLPGLQVPPHREFPAPCDGGERQQPLCPTALAVAWEQLLGKSPGPPLFFSPRKGGTVLQVPAVTPRPLGWAEAWTGKGTPMSPSQQPYNSIPTSAVTVLPELPVFPRERPRCTQPARVFSWIFWCFYSFQGDRWLLDIFCCCGSIQAYTEQEIKHLRSSSCEESVCLSPSLTLIHEQASSPFLVTTAPFSWSCRRPKAVMGRLTGQTVAGH